jgi:hypothetical protein
MNSLIAIQGWLCNGMARLLKLLNACPNGKRDAEVAKGLTGLFSSAPAQLYDSLLVNAFNDVTTNHGARDRGIAEPPQHDRLDLGRGHVEDAISDVIARKDSSDLSAIGTPPCIVHGDAPATPSLDRRGRSREQGGRRRCDNEMVKSLHVLSPC